MKNAIKAIKNPAKALLYLALAIKYRTLPKKKVLIFIGSDPNGELNILYPGYKKCYVFEPHPGRYARLLKKFGKSKNISIFNCAVADYNGVITFNISSNNDGASSSVGNFDCHWQNEGSSKNISMVQTIQVPCINLLNFCEKYNLTYIDDYVSDIQGMDLHVLATLKPMIDRKQIGSIKCEVTKDQFRNVYHDLPDNTETGFKNLLGDNYKLVAKGYGLLKDNRFDMIPDDAWEMDCKWKVKS